MSEIKAKILSSNNGAVGYDANGVLWQTKDKANADLTVGGAGWQALDANGGAGNYEVILPIGAYTSGTYSYPNGRSESDYHIIGMLQGQAGSSSSQRGSSIMTAEVVAIPWVNLSVQTWTSSEVSVSLARNDAFSFVVSAVSSEVTTVYGYLKEGVI
jgi:hypothetical protein